ncbi:hypothetical protein VPHD526_0015 [Vibrio phage D526]
MQKYIPYLIVGVVAGLIVKSKSLPGGVSGSVPRPEAETGDSWWKFW